MCGWGANEAIIMFTLFSSLKQIFYQQKREFTCNQASNSLTLTYFCPEILYHLLFEGCSRLLEYKYHHKSEFADTITAGVPEQQRGKL